MKNIYLTILIYLSNSANALNNHEFINLLLVNNAFFEKEMINLEIKNIEMKGDYDDYANWEWDVAAEIGRVNKSKNKQNYTSSTDYAKSTNQDVQKISTDLSKKFFSNGSELSFSYDKSLPIKNEEMHDKNGYQQDKNTTEYLDDISLSWTLPLLKNSEGVIDQKTYDIAVLDYKDERLLLDEVQEDFIEDKLMIFIDFISYKRQSNIVRLKLEKLQKILKYSIQNKAHISDISILKRSINKSKRLLLSLESKLGAELDLLRGLISNKRVFTKVSYDDSFSLIEDIGFYLKENSRDLKRINIENAKNQRHIKSYKNAKLPELDFTLSATRDENKGNYSTYTRSTENEYEAKIELSYSLTGDTSNRTLLSKYRLKTKQLELKYKDKFDDISADVAKLSALIKQDINNLKLYGLQNELDDPFQQLTQDQKTNIRFVIDEMNDIEDLYVDYIIQSVELYKNQVKYDALLDRLLPKKH